ncbi:hypothetical protein TCDM_00625 [Trypanosoma cruzi Dm28c]|uniref:Uncharacterized protein n=1 Tax=Trypanosoma cruzi Dm28c TaxID=1416333 RepID=V5BW88_TRYCR|nr:hypothetical protein TCDM_00625 [Trypanosoma cruzi Dm28c]
MCLLLRVPLRLSSFFLLFPFFAFPSGFYFSRVCGCVWKEEPLFFSLFPFFFVSVGPSFRVRSGGGWAAATRSRNKNKNTKRRGWWLNSHGRDRLR